MPRQPRHFVLGQCSHVMVRGTHRQFRLIRDGCREVLLYAIQNRRVHSRRHTPNPTHKKCHVRGGQGGGAWRKGVPRRGKA